MISISSCLTVSHLRYYRDAGRKWIILGGDNYGEGSSREVAAMSPRYMGCFAVIAKSMARLHETVSTRCMRRRRLSLIGVSAESQEASRFAVVHRCKGLRQDSRRGKSRLPYEREPTLAYIFCQMEIQELAGLRPGSTVTLRLWKEGSGGESVAIPLRHSMTAREIEWYVPCLSSGSVAETV